MRTNSAEDYTICGSRLQREMITQKVAISYRIGASDLSIQSELSWGQTPTFIGDRPQLSECAGRSAQLEAEARELGDGAAGVVRNIDVHDARKGKRVSDLEQRAQRAV